MKPRLTPTEKRGNSRTLRLFSTYRAGRMYACYWWKHATLHSKAKGNLHS